MNTANESRRRTRWQPFRLAALGLLRLGLPGEVFSISGMVFGIAAGVCFLFTGESENENLFWILALLLCLLRLLSLRLEAFMRHVSTGTALDDLQELPERVSDAVTLIGFGFAARSNPWLGLAAALAAVFSAYIRSFGVLRGAAQAKAAAGPMTRNHRLLLLSISSALMLSNVAEFTFQTTIPVITLWTILLGCLATIVIRLRRIRK